MKGLKFTSLLFVLCLGIIPDVTVAQVSTRATAREEFARLLQKRNLLALPSLASQVRGYSGASRSRGTTTISSTLPPTLETIASSSIKNIFWRDVNGINIVDAISSMNPEPNQCGEFYSGSEDGQSAGLGACHMAESVGYSYSNVIESGTSLCYMRNFATNKNLAAGAITIDSGEFPEGGIQKLFSPPSGANSKLVKVNFIDEQDGGGQQVSSSGQSIFLKVASRLENKAANNLYKVDIWFCKPDDTIALGYDTITITKSLQFLAGHADTNEFGENISNATGFLIAKGSNLIWDSSRPRTSSILFSDTINGGLFKSEIEITADRTIKVKHLDNFQDAVGKGYLITKYAGSNAQDLRFLSGAFKNSYKDLSFSQATEYRDTYYAVDRTSNLLKEVEDADLNSEFYTSNLEINFDTSQYSCEGIPDLEATLDFTNPILRDSVKECEEERLDNMHFCHDDSDVYRADQSFGQACSGPP